MNSQLKTQSAEDEILLRVKRISASLYNDGYYKANVRDLSGAISSLQSSLKYNKYNTEARNLLGLVYYEIGETVNALSEWVISASLQPVNNPASRYLSEIKETRGLMEQIKLVTRKYNQAIYYCSKNNTDMAILQLKNVIAANPKMLKAHQLLALLYLKTGQLEKARKELKEAGNIDSANTLTFRYTKEVNQQIRLRAGSSEPQESEELVTYQNGNETVIMPKRSKESSLGSKIGYMVFGLALGCITAVSILLPSAETRTRAQVQDQVLEISNQLSTDRQEMSALEVRIDYLQSELDAGIEEKQNMDTRIQSYQSLLNAFITYSQSDAAQTENYLAEIDKKLLDDQALYLYNELEKMLAGNASPESTDSAAPADLVLPPDIMPQTAPIVP